MIQITLQMRILVAIASQDFRKGSDALSGVCLNLLMNDPFSGSLFVFRNKGGTAIKVVVYDGQGFWLCQKRLSKVRFRYWPKGEGTVNPLLAHELQLLIWNGSPGAGAVAPMWKKVCG